uniref:Tubulin polyglutamylase TTLL4 n=2 Tax=Cacopsylla melanoneura TaxID=428564 RepID=A0A8D8RRT1_9HEMI
MTSFEVAYHRSRNFGPLSSTPYCMDSLGYEIPCAKCDRMIATFTRKRSKSECCADSSRWKASPMSEPRMLRSSNRPLFTNSNTIYKTEVHKASKLCERCDDSKSAYSVEMEELRRQLRQVGRNHYNPRSEAVRNSITSRDFNMREIPMSGHHDSTRSTVRQLRPRRFVLPKSPPTPKSCDLPDVNKISNGTVSHNANSVLVYNVHASQSSPFDTELENTRVLRNTTKYYPSNTPGPVDRKFQDKHHYSPPHSHSSSDDLPYLPSPSPSTTPSPLVSEKRSRTGRKPVTAVPPLKLKCKSEGVARKGLTNNKPVQDEEMEEPSPPSAAMEIEPVTTSTLPLETKLFGKIIYSPSDDHPGLRMSLFTNVSPYIRFSSHDDQVRVFPTPVAKYLKWKLSPITPVVVKKTILNTGFRLVRKSSEWCGTWGKHMKSLSFRTLKESQKINHFPGTFQIGRKDRLWKNLLKCMMKYGEKEFGFSPRTYVLPGDDKLLRATWERNCGNIKWIVKPPASARGVGIKVVHKWSQIPRKVPLVVQKYLDDPYLINDTKFDLRLYVLVTSFNPLRIYLYDNGLVRFASVKYNSNSETLQDRYMHLTNYSINKLSSSYTQNEDAEACQGHKWTLKSLWSYMETERGVDVTALQDSIMDVVIKTMICGEHSISQLTRANQQSRYCSYELFGIDILLDSKLKPWLLEVNISPSLHSSSPLDLAVKGPMVQDLFNIVGFQLPAKIPPQCTKAFGLDPTKSMVYDKRLYTPLLSNEEREKHVSFIQNNEREEYLSSILENLTPDDVRHLVVYEDEVTQLGSFIKVFPTTTSHKYFQYFEGSRYYNMLFDAWETAYHADRLKGIRILEDQCIQGVHLDISHVISKPTQTSPIPQSEEPSPTAETEPDVVRSSSNISLTCAASLCRNKSARPRPLRSYVTRRTSRHATKQSAS